MQKKRNIGIIVFMTALSILSGCAGSAPMQAVETTSALAASQATEAVQATETVQATEAVQTTEAAQAMEAVQTSETAQATEAAQATETPVPTETASKNVINSQDVIGEERAIEIAFERAGVSRESATVMDVELDREHNRLEYEIDFRVSNVEYDVSIDAYTGEVVEFSQEYE